MIFVEVGIAFYNNYNPKLNQKQYGFYFFVMVIFPALMKLLLYLHNFAVIFRLHRLEHRSVADNGILNRCAGNGRLVTVQVIQEIVYQLLVAAAVSACRANHIPLHVQVVYCFLVTKLARRRSHLSYHVARIVKRTLNFAKRTDNMNVAFGFCATAHHTERTRRAVCEVEHHCLMVYVAVTLEIPYALAVTVIRPQGFRLLFFRKILVRFQALPNVLPPTRE